MIDRSTVERGAMGELSLLRVTFPVQRCERVYDLDHFYAPRDEDPSDSTAGVVHWNWRKVGQRRAEVMLWLEGLPTPDRPEYVSVRGVALFDFSEVGENEDKIRQFVQYGAPMIIFPYVRERVADVTSHGEFGPFVLPVVNVRAMMQGFDPGNAEGYGQDWPEPVSTPPAAKAEDAD